MTQNNTTTYPRVAPYLTWFDKILPVPYYPDSNFYYAPTNCPLGDNWSALSPPDDMHHEPRFHNPSPHAQTVDQADAAHNETDKSAHHTLATKGATFAIAMSDHRHSGKADR